MSPFDIRDIPAFLFDSLAQSAAGVRREAASRFEVVGSPGEPLSRPLEAGDLYLWRALGEGALGGAEPIVDGELIEASAVPQARRRPGRYVELARSASPTAGRLRRITDQRGRVPRGVLVLRLRDATPAGERGVELDEEAGAFADSVLRTVENLIQELRLAETAKDTARMDDLEREILKHMGNEKVVVKYGIWFALWLLQRSKMADTESVLQHIEDGWTKALAHNRLPPLGPGSVGSPLGFPGPGGLIDRAKADARSGRHRLAFRFFRLAYRLLQMLLLQTTNKRTAKLRDASVPGGQTAGRVITYRNVRGIYERMRTVLGFYLELEHEALIAGRAQDARTLASLGAGLHSQVRSRDVRNDNGMTGEVHLVRTPQRDFLQFHGANHETTDLTQLPGLPAPTTVVAPLSQHSIHRTGMAGIERALRNQVIFIAKLRRSPQIQRAFRGRTIDMVQRGDRLLVWERMYRGFRAANRTTALARLMELIGQYVGAFTFHTWYNIRDWGKSYLKTEMPTDLLGRAAHDCGVYALYVAYEVYRTVRPNGPRLDFELISIPNHVTLIIRDRAARSFFMVNNDRISSPLSGPRLAAVARAAAATFGRRYLITPAFRLSLGSTRDSDKDFRHQLWQRHLDSVAWSLAPTPAATAAVYTRFYHEQEIFDRFSGNLDGLLELLRRNAAALSSPRDERELLARTLNNHLRDVLTLSNIFLMWGPQLRYSTNPNRRGVGHRLGRSIYFFSQRPGHSHPLSRFAKGLLRLNHLGGTLSQDAQAIIAFVDSIPDFHAELNNYRNAGFPAAF